ncbi:ANM_HP_G0245820.mRNA.1.CDS.1 [Saccharomyces cerevisiae]|nr:ANM_HP_G0099140.mRNA.1.CDS.1 [Saccharomyces cerevisiae]CAI5191594.1 ANM_HP_G0245820.mRNA.1.CDS.1 [Saccharomyces cerevisiae]CAI6399212.1 ANM_HP_G0099140.mRNA.1.CDS.1 [Saccharomyces cerevisiae]CAI7004284.1 ANM_HP_G0245820.mRNA.1.CDS.1 [Saccharomyces cerevisiae]
MPVSSIQCADHSYSNWQKESEKTKLPKLGCPTEYTEYYKTASSGETTDSAVVSSIATNRLKRKRQRDGASCDSCRIKKIKCNATIIIFLQDRKPNFINFFKFALYTFPRRHKPVSNEVFQETA